MSFPNMIRVNRAGSKGTTGFAIVGPTIRTSSSLLQSFVLRKKSGCASGRPLARRLATAVCGEIEQIFERNPLGFAQLQVNGHFVEVPKQVMV